MSIIGVCLSVAAGPFLAAYIANDEKSLSDKKWTGVMLIGVPLIFLAYVIPWHVVLGGSLTNLLLANEDHHKVRFGMYFSYGMLSAGLSMFFAWAWGFLRNRNGKT